MLVILLARLCVRSFSSPPLPTHTKSQQSETVTFLTVLLQTIFSCCGEWELSGPRRPVWIIPVILSLDHYSNKEDTYYHSRAVSSQSDPDTCLPCRTLFHEFGFEAAHTPFRLNIHNSCQYTRLHMHAQTYMGTDPHPRQHSLKDIHGPIYTHKMNTAITKLSPPQRASRSEPREGEVYIYLL